MSAPTGQVARRDPDSGEAVRLQYTRCHATVMFICEHLTWITG